MNGPKPGFETLKAPESGRRLVSASGRQEVQAKVFHGADGSQFLILRSWVGSPPAPGATAEWSEPSLWSHLALDEQLNVVATGFGRRERDSFAMLRKALAVKGIDTGEGGDVAQPESEAAEEGTSSRHDRFVWQPDDVEILTPEQAAEALGFDPEADKTSSRGRVSDRGDT